MFQRCQPVAANSNGDYCAGSGPRALAAAVLTAAAADATASIVDGNGAVVATLAAKAGTSAPFTPARAVTFITKLTVTITGASATLTLYEA